MPSAFEQHSDRGRDVIDLSLDPSNVFTQQLCNIAGVGGTSFSDLLGGSVHFEEELLADLRRLHVVFVHLFNDTLEHANAVLQGAQTSVPVHVQILRGQGCAARDSGEERAAFTFPALQLIAALPAERVASVATFPGDAADSPLMRAA